MGTVVLNDKASSVDFLNGQGAAEPIRAYVVEIIEAKSSPSAYRVGVV